MTSKVGFGYDIHKLAKGRKLFLGGVSIPYSLGLLGHSDADVILHAISDALLGALGKGDIGELFPNTDKKYKDISSLILLDKVFALVRKEKFIVGNVDVMVLAEAPKISPFKQKMRAVIAKRLSIGIDSVSIKATTQEGIGFGKAGKNAIAAYAVTLISKE